MRRQDDEVAGAGRLLERAVADAVPLAADELGQLLRRPRADGDLMSERTERVRE